MFEVMQFIRPAKFYYLIIILHIIPQIQLISERYKMSKKNNNNYYVSNVNN